MVTNQKEQEIRKFIKWLYRNNYIIARPVINALGANIALSDNTEEDSLNLVGRYWRDVNG